MSSPPSTPQAPVDIGDVLLDKYRVDKILGAGGMGVVVAATHLELGQRVAVKFLHPDALATPEALARFQREARAAAKIRNEHVARVMDIGRLDSGAPYMVLEYLEGEDLASVVSRGPLPIEDAVDYVIQACDAMVDAHAEGIIHRDLKPANLFLMYRSDGSGVVKVLDFGISKVTQPELGDRNLTSTRAVMGSPFYMSPEQMRSSRDVDYRTDVWALGVILFELLAGQTPFTGETFTDLVGAIMGDPPKSLTALRPDAPPALVDAVMKCLEKSPEHRFQNVAELAHAIVEFGSRRSRVTADRVLKVAGIEAGVESPPRASAPAVAPTVPMIGSGTDTNWAETQRGSEKRGRGVMLGAVAVLAIGGIGGMAAVLADGAAAPAPAEATSAQAGPTQPVATAVAPKDEKTPVLADTQPASAADTRPDPREEDEPAAPTPAAKPAPKPTTTATPRRKPASVTKPRATKATAAPARRPAPPKEAPKKTDRRRDMNMELK